jgi:hypothetical protein
MDDDLVARRSFLNQKKELCNQSYSALKSISKKTNEIQKDIRVLLAKDERDLIALEALQAAIADLDAESNVETSRYMQLQRDFIQENISFHAYLARRQSDRLNREAPPDIVSFECDIFLLFALPLLYTFSY